MSLLDDITIRGDQVRGRLYEFLQRHEYEADTKNAVLVAYVAIALEHHKSIWILSKLRLNGSAFALLRAVFEAYWRALWINKVATPEQIEQASRDELRFPKMRQMRADIKQAYFATPDEKELTPDELAEAQRLRELGDKFFGYVKKMWPALNSYTHSGALQIGRRFTGDQVKANYSEADIAQALTVATTGLLLLLHMFFISTEHYDEVQEIHKMLAQYRYDFSERLQALKNR
jgi:uncharacterized protein DUF6988